LKKEARILLIKCCRNGIVLLVLRYNSVEEIALVPNQKFDSILSYLKTIGEVRYYTCIDCEDNELFRVIASNYGLRELNKLEFLHLIEVEKMLETFCCMLNYMVRTIPGNQTYLCITQ